MTVSQFFDNVDEFNEQIEKQKFIDHLHNLKSMTVEEVTFRQKYLEIQDYKWAYHESTQLKTQLWKPTDIFNREQTLAEIVALRPRLIYADRLDQRWLLHRVFISSANFDQNPGRFLRFFLIDETSEKILGITSIGSDVIAMRNRDQWIGWTETDKLRGKLNNTCIATTIVPTQPFGYNFLGGKLLASMLVTGEPERMWKDEYDDVLAGITTTSLYGNGSMYNSIPWWKSLGETAGAMSVKPDHYFYDTWHQIVKKKYPEIYKQKLTGSEGHPPTAVKQRIMSLIFKEVGVKQSQFSHGFNRGIYFARLYKNTNEFLCGKISESELIPLERDRSAQTVIDWWRKKAIARYETLFDQNRLKPETLYHNNLIFMTFDEAKAQYLPEIGR